MSKEKDFEPSNLSRSQIEKLAELFAEKAGYIPGSNTDLFDCVKSVGGKIIYSDLNIHRNGGSINVKNKDDFTIYLSRYTSPKRDIFTIAHELGHYVLHSRLGEIPISAGRDEDIDLAEKEANSFAAAFLMPEKLLKEQYALLKGDMFALASIFNVSSTAMLWRCKNLGLYTDD